MLTTISEVPIGEIARYACGCVVRKCEPRFPFLKHPMYFYFEPLSSCTCCMLGRSRFIYGGDSVNFDPLANALQDRFAR